MYLGALVPDVVRAYYVFALVPLFFASILLSWEAVGSYFLRVVYFTIVVRAGVPWHQVMIGVARVLTIEEARVGDSVQERAIEIGL